MRIILFTLVVLSGLLFNSQAQEPLAINVSSKESTFSINGNIFSAKSTSKDIEKVLGKPERISTLGGVDAIFAYDQKGFAYTINPHTKTIKLVSITFIYDGDKKVAKETFKGKLSINNEAVDQQSSIISITKASDLQFKEAMKGLHMAKSGQMAIIAYYPESPSTLGQFGLEF